MPRPILFVRGKTITSPQNKIVVSRQAIIIHNEARTYFFVQLFYVQLICIRYLFIVGDNNERDVKVEEATIVFTICT